MHPKNQLYAPIEGKEEFVKMPNTTRIDIKGKGHCLNAEAPEEIIKAIKLMDK